MSCSGNGMDHCCYLIGRVCPHLEEATVPGRHWVCGLYRELGSWDAVEADARYLRDVQPMWDIKHPGFGCGDWPQNMPEKTICSGCGYGVEKNG